MVLKVTGDVSPPVAVTEGVNDGVRVQILSGLAAGDTVVADARRQVDRRRPGARGRRALIPGRVPTQQSRKPCGYPTHPSSVRSSPRWSS